MFHSSVVTDEPETLSYQNPLFRPIGSDDGQSTAIIRRSFLKTHAIYFMSDLTTAPKVVATIEARMTSSRLPGKVLLPILGKPILYYLVERIKAAKTIDQIILATTANTTDDVLADFARSIGIEVFRGSEDDVMSRVLAAAEQNNADIIVQITGDCPLIDPELIDQVVRTFKVNVVDYVSNSHVRSYPDGMDVAVFSSAALKTSEELTDDSYHREHVSVHIREHPDVFRAIYLVSPSDSYWPELGLTIDEQPDYELIKQVIEYFWPTNPNFRCKDIVDLLRNKPHWVALNESVKRRSWSLDSIHP